MSAAAQPSRRHRRHLVLVLAILAAIGITVPLGSDYSAAQQGRPLSVQFGCQAHGRHRA